VFVNSSLDEVAAAAENEALSMIQLHGDEGPAFCREAARRTGCKVIKALSVRSTAEVVAAEAYRTEFHLLDTYHARRRGGTGESFDWELLAGRRSEVPLILAGGLTPANVAEGIAAARPFAVDVASGVEAEPGVKDPALMAAFIERAQAASASDEATDGPAEPDPRVIA
jgi:phosphoribosylanthranilate isomerase